MKEYHKIETLFIFDKETKKHIYGEFYNPNVEALKNVQWIITEKIDGMNFRIFWDGHKLSYGGRTDNATFTKEQEEYIRSELINKDIEILFEQKFMEKQVYIYGELYGVGIQSGGMYTNGYNIDFKVFDIEIDGVILTKYGARDLAFELGYNFVPIVGEMTLIQALDKIKSEETSYFSSAKLEGYVATPIGDFRDRLGRRIIVKIKKRDIEL